MRTPPDTCYEVADSHPAARTTVIRRCAGTGPAEAASVTLRHQVTLEPLAADACDWFVRDGGWSGWRVSARDGLAGRWVYTRPVDAEPEAWPPETWQDCVARYERCARRHTARAGAGDGDGGWRARLERDLAVAAAMMDAMGTADPMNPFDLVDDRIGAGVLKATIADIGATYRSDGPGTRIEPRGLSAVLTKVGVPRATRHLVEPHFIDRAEAWLCEQAAAGASLGETDRLEQRLLGLMTDRDFVCVAGFCALAAMCELDPDAAVLWYRTGGDCSGHPDIRSYAAQARRHLPLPPPVQRKPAPAGKNPARGTGRSKPRRLVHCGAPTLTGSVCRHKVSPSTKACPAGHEQRRP
ncbi:MAG: hypothetical protein OXP08_08475 [bacterium]|nr:hypothetical protein [bacterium]